MSPVHWFFQIWRVLYFVLTNNFCLIILLLFCIILTNRSTWCSGKASVQTPSGPGFESQVPHFLNIFSFQVIVCTLKFATYHAPSPIQAPDGQWPDLVVHDWRYTKAQVNAPTLDQRKSNGLADNGPSNCYQHPSKAGPILLFSFIYFLFEYFNCFI